MKTYYVHYRSTNRSYHTTITLSRGPPKGYSLKSVISAHSLNDAWMAYLVEVWAIPDLSVGVGISMKAPFLDINRHGRNRELFVD